MTLCWRDSWAEFLKDPLTWPTKGYYGEKTDNEDSYWRLILNPYEESSQFNAVIYRSQELSYFQHPRIFVIQRCLFITKCML